MRKLLFFAGLLIMPWCSHDAAIAQAPEWEWAKSFGGPETEGHDDMALDNQGNFYITGQFQSAEVDFETFVLTTDDFSHYVVKFNNDGEAIWGKALGTASPYSSIYPDAIAIDSEDNVYISGAFYGP